MNKRKAAALDFIYATYQVDRDELKAIAVLKTVDPDTDIIAMCDVYADIARDNAQDERDQQAAQHAEPICAECAECAAIEALINAVISAIDHGTSRATIKQIIASALQ